MFGWFKRRLLKEHRMLAFQTYRAATDASMPLSLLVKGGLDGKAIYADAEQEAELFVRALGSSEKLATDQIEAIFNLNKKLRLMFDEYGHENRAFDVVYRPLGGWDFYFENNSNELHLIDQQMEIKDYVENERRSREG